LRSQFSQFAKFGDTAADGKTIKLSQSDKWFRQAAVITKETITTTDTGIAFKKVSKSSPKINYSTWLKYLEILAASKNVDIQSLKSKLSSCGPPATNKATVVPQSTTVARLTDTSRYGGTHRERFDSDGKGRGKEGRVDGPSDGYVNGYKHKGTYGTGMARTR